MPTNLTDYNIEDTYGGIIHASGTQLPIANKVDLYDGVGNKSSLKIGRAGYGATVYAGSNTDGFTVLGDISATGRCVLGHMEALSGTTGSNIPKAYVCFNPSDSTIYTKYGISNINRVGVGKYTLNIDSDTNSILETMSDSKYAIFINMSIDEADQDQTNIYSAVASDASNNNVIIIRCTKYNGTNISFYEPSEISVSIFKSK